MAEYDFFDMETMSLNLLKDGAEVEIHVRDRETMESKAVRALVAKSPDKLPGGERLYVYGRLGVAVEGEWYIQILEELGEEALQAEVEEARLLERDMGVGTAEEFRKPRRKA